VGNPLNQATTLGPMARGSFADVVRGRKGTSYPSVRTDLVNAGAHWVDKAVVVDGNLITSRRPADLDAFGDALLRQLDSADSPAAAAR